MAISDRHHVEPLQLYVPKESFPIPLRYIDVVRTARAILDVFGTLTCESKLIGVLDWFHAVHNIE